MPAASARAATTTLIAHGPPLPLAERRRSGHRAARPQRAPLSAARCPTWLRALHALVREFKPDVVHTQSVRTTVAVALAAPRTPLLATVHGIEESEELAAALALRAEPRARGGRLAGLGRRAAAPPAGAAGRDRAARRRHRRARARARSRPATPIPDRRPLVTCLARHYPVKGVDVLVDAFPRVLEPLPGAGLLLVGGGPEYDALMARVEQLGIAAAVTFTDHQHESRALSRRGRPRGPALAPRGPAGVGARGVRARARRRGDGRRRNARRRARR